MEKYLGNKSTLLPLIEGFIKNRIPRAKKVSELFGGTNNFSRYFRARGWETATCDSNRFSYVLAHAYLKTKSSPRFKNINKSTVDDAQMKRLEHELERGINRYGKIYLAEIDIAKKFKQDKRLAEILCTLQMAGESNRKSGVITNYFTQWGKHSKYTSLRGTTGTRNYFSKPNSLILDGVLQLTRKWWKDGLLSRDEVFILLASIIEEVVITANVNGTFHDFNRNKIWPNAEQKFQLRIPIIEYGGPKGEIANADSMLAARNFEIHDVCYLDPPYNFRQYNAYYHFLNFIAAYPFLDSLEDYVSGLMHVRGQHPQDDFTSSFCFKEKFLESLATLTENVRAGHIVLSYYGGRNHWNHWSEMKTPDDQGLKKIQSLFEDKNLFSHCEIISALDIRKNYQSRIGEQKELVNEYLFHGKIKTPRSKKKTYQNIANLSSNDFWGISDIFRHAPSDN